MGKQSQQTYLVRTDNLPAKHHTIGQRVIVGQVDTVKSELKETQVYGVIIGGVQNTYKAVSQFSTMPWAKPVVTEIVQCHYAIKLDSGATVVAEAEDIVFVYNTNIKCVSKNGSKAVKKSATVKNSKKAESK